MAVQPTSTSIGAVQTGIVKLTVDGTTYRVKGAIDYNLGYPMRETILGQDAPHGYKLTPQTPFVECATTDGNDYDIQQILTAANISNITVELSNGKQITYTDCWYAGEGTVNTEESELTLRFESVNRGSEIPA